jgi:hypothetical protein
MLGEELDGGALRALVAQAAAILPGTPWPQWPR